MRARTHLAALLCSALGSLCLSAAPATAAEPPHPFRGTITGAKVGPSEQFKDICGIAVDSKGDIYLADYYQNRILVFNKREEFLTKIDSVDPLDAGGVAPIDGPCQLAVDSTGRLYLNDYHRDVASFTPAVYPPLTGTPYTPGPSLDTSEPTGLAVDPASNDLYVDERSSVAVFDPSGTQLPPIATTGLKDAYGLAVSAFPGTLGHLYLADAATDTVEVYDPLGPDPSTPIETINGAGTPRAGFSSLVDAALAVDPANGHLYITDNLKPHFEKPETIVDEFSATGHYRDQVPHPVAEGESSFLQSGEGSGLAVGEAGNLYVSSGNYENAAVFVFGPGDGSPTLLLKATETGTGSGTLASSPAGLRCPGACVGEFEEGANVTLTATPERGSRLLGWSGCDANLSANTCRVAMSAARALSAEFGPAPQQTLSVAKGGSGAGTVASAPAGIDCGGACAGEFDEGSSAVLTATPAPGSDFAGWSGCDSEPSPDSCKVTMNAARALSARFEPEPQAPPPPAPGPQRRTLTVSASGLGGASGTILSAPAGIDCGASCSHVYERGAALTLTAQPAPGSLFLGWGGCEAEAGVTCTLALGSDRDVVAAFGPGPPGPLAVGKVLLKGASATLSVAVPGPGSLSGTGKWLTSAKTLPLAGGEATLRLALNPAGRAALAKNGRLESKVKLAFAPLQGGATSRLAKTLLFRGKGK